MSKLSTEEVIKRANAKANGAIVARASKLLERAQDACLEASKLFEAANDKDRAARADNCADVLSIIRTEVSS